MKRMFDRHLKRAELQAYVDGAQSGEARALAERHLSRCRRCSQTVTDLRANERLVSSRLAALSQTPPRAPLQPIAARRRLAFYEESRDKEAKMPWYTKWFTRRAGPAWVAVVIVVVLAVSMAFAPVRALAGQFLGLFRVQQIEVVEFNPSELFGEGGPEAAMQSLEKVMDEQVEVTVSGEPQTVDETALRSLSSIRVRLPQAVSGEPHYRLQPSAEVNVHVDLPRIRALLTELGYTDVELPDDLDGAEVSVSLAPSVVASYGSCDPIAAHEPGDEAWDGTGAPGGLDGDCTVLVQMVSPAVSAPDGLDVEMLGQAYLQLLGMSPEEAAAFSRQIDWTATLIMPLPRSEVTYQELAVDGVTGVLIRPTTHRLPTDEYLLMWVNDGIVYTLTGSGSTAGALRTANSLN